MIKARSGDNMLFGLSAGNIERLIQGQPMMIDLRDIGFEKGHVVIFYGRTEEDMKRDLLENGVLLPSSS